MPIKELFFTLTLLSTFATTATTPWGFHAHKIINRTAVFILPPEMMALYKPHIDYLSEHATDPDKRRYAVKGEAIRHYMDMEHWQDIHDLPKEWEDALARFLELGAVLRTDTVWFKTDTMVRVAEDRMLLGQDTIEVARYETFIRKHIVAKVGKEPMRFPTDSLNAWLGSSIDSGNYPEVFCREQISQYGINPYHIQVQYRRLVYAFRSKDIKAILRLSADMGHYVADAHVPLHATANYNGQLTGQEGIHAFWESRLPELFAETQYDYVVGKARYIRDIAEFAWGTIKTSHLLSEKVLGEEADLSRSYPVDLQYGYDERLGRTVRTQTVEYATAYHRSLNGMVEDRMQDAVLALGSIWMSAWIDAGQPDLGDVPDFRWLPGDILRMEVLERQYENGEEIGRACGK